ncbi:hypothetical protein, partial [Pseudovibrio sp. WM33]|uniref:hypothetical protein n=1 Tax=Pseudovibrio sp. WM33 TaxID=1735585 RepID=UPI0019D40185
CPLATHPKQFGNTATAQNIVSSLTLTFIRSDFFMCDLNEMHLVNIMREKDISRNTNPTDGLAARIARYVSNTPSKRI